MSLINIKNLSFNYFDKNILNNMNLELNENDKLLLVGRNGAGKSTLLRLISGLNSCHNYDNFSILGTSSPNDQFNGVAYLGNRWVRNISFMGQSSYTADIRAGDMMKKWQEDNIERRDELVRVLEINLDWKMHEVSDGQRKKVQILLALLKPFKLLVIDEFLNELDIIVRDNLLQYIDKEIKIRNGVFIYATHIFDNLDKFMNKILFIDDGTTGEIEELKLFNINNNLFSNIKNKFIEMGINIPENNEKVDPRKFGSHYGYSHGRSEDLI